MKNEENELKKLYWRSSVADNLANRKYIHLTYLFEVADDVAIAPAENITENPTGE